MTYIRNPAAILKDEHDLVLVKLNTLEDIFKHLDQREVVMEELVKIALFFRASFWDHFDKEEKALFPEFDNFMPHGVGPLAVMVDEHGVIRDGNDAMQSSIEKYLNLDSSTETRQAIVENGTHFIEYLRGHIIKENSLFVSLVDMHLDEVKRARVIKQFDEIARNAVR